MGDIPLPRRHVAIRHDKMNKGGLLHVGGSVDCSKAKGLRPEDMSSYPRRGSVVQLKYVIVHETLEAKKTRP